jgi:stress response protein YsnF
MTQEPADNKNYFTALKKSVFYLTASQVKEISEAVNDRAIDMDVQLNDKDKHRGIYSKDEIKHFLEILEPLGDLFDELDSFLYVAPGTEPVIKCEVLYSKALKEGQEETTKQIDREKRMGDRYDVNMWG